MTDRPAEQWMELLDRTETAIQQATQRIVDPPEWTPPSFAPIEGLQRVDQRLASWNEGLAHLEAEAAAIERSLDADEQALKLWLLQLRDLGPAHPAP